MKTVSVITVLLLVASICHAQTNATASPPDRQTKSESKKVNRVQIPTHIAESITQRISLPHDIGIVGDVVLETLVEKDGKVLSVRAVSGDSRLVRAAKRAVMKWVFTPYFVNGDPVQFLTELTFQFDGRSQFGKLKVENGPLTQKCSIARSLQMYFTCGE